jgi:hypothetical protein
LINIKTYHLLKNYYDELISYFYDGLPADVAYKIKYDNDVETMSVILVINMMNYQFGARNIINNKIGRV